MKVGAKCEWPRKHLPDLRPCATCGTMVKTGHSAIRFCSALCRVTYKRLLENAA